MRAKLGADAAMFANNGFLVNLVKLDGVHNTSLPAFLAADAFIFRQNYAAAFSGRKRIRRAG